MEFNHDWYLGPCDGEAWQDAVRRSVPNLFALFKAEVCPGVTWRWALQKTAFSPSLTLSSLGSIWVRVQPSAPVSSRMLRRRHVDTRVVRLNGEVNCTGNVEPSLKRKTALMLKLPFLPSTPRLKGGAGPVGKFAMGTAVPGQ